MSSRNPQAGSRNTILRMTNDQEIIAMLEIETVSGRLAQQDQEILKQRRQMIERDELLLVKDRLLDRYANKKKRMDFFSGTQSDSDDPSV